MGIADFGCGKSGHAPIFPLLDCGWPAKPDPDRRRHRRAGECASPGAALAARLPRDRARGRAAACLVRVLEPDAEQVEVRWDDGAAGRRRSTASTRRACSRAACRSAGRSQPYRLHIRYRDGAEHTKHDPYFFAPQLVGLRPAPVRRGQPPRHLPQARRAPDGARRPRRHALRRLGAERRARQRRRAVQPLGRPAPRHAGARRLGHLGAVHPRRRPRHRLQVRDPHPQRPARCSRPIPTASRCSCGPPTARWSPSLERLRLAATRPGCRRAPRADPLRAADQHLRGASRLVAARLRPHAAVPELARARRRADPLRARPGLHARRADGRRRAPVRRLLGLPGGGLLRAVGAVRHAAGLHALRRPLPPGRHRRDPRLGAGALPARRPRPRRGSTARRSTSTTTRASASTPTGARRSSTTAATRCATSWSRTRCTGSTSTTSTACAWTRSPRCSTSTTAASPASGCRTATAAARTSTRSTSCGS